LICDTQQNESKSFGMRISRAIVLVMSMFPSGLRWWCSITRLEGFNSSTGTHARIVRGSGND
jgi:hypothetical protein